MSTPSCNIALRLHRLSRKLCVRCGKRHTIQPSRSMWKRAEGKWLTCWECREKDRARKRVNKVKVKEKIMSKVDEQVAIEAPIVSCAKLSDELFSLARRYAGPNKGIVLDSLFNIAEMVAKIPERCSNRLL